MSTHFIFPSLANPESYGFEFDSDRWFNCLGSDHCGSAYGYFDTYGDGLVKHSPARPVMLDKAQDLIYSLMAHVLTMPGEIPYNIRTSFSPKISAETKAFIRGFKGTKKYFSVEERKETDSESKQHDKRYHETSKLGKDEGGIRRHFNIFLRGMDDTGYGYFFDQFHRIAHIVDLSEGMSGYDVAEAFPEFKERDGCGESDVLKAWRAMRDVVKGFELLDYGRRVIEGVQHNLAWKRKQEAAKAAPSPETVAA